MLRHHGARLGADCVDMQSVAARQFFGMFYRWSRPGHLVGKKHSVRNLRTSRTSFRDPSPTRYGNGRLKFNPVKSLLVKPVDDQASTEGKNQEVTTTRDLEVNFSPEQAQLLQGTKSRVQDSKENESIPLRSDNHTGIFLGRSGESVEGVTGESTARPPRASLIRRYFSGKEDAAEIQSMASRPKGPIEATEIPSGEFVSINPHQKAPFAMPPLKEKEGPAEGEPKMELPMVSDKLRKIMRTLPASVVVVTTALTASDKDYTHSNARGMTLSSFTTVTLTPEPIIQFNVKAPSRTLDALMETRHCLVHILEATETGASIASAFTKGNSPDKSPFTHRGEYKVNPIQIKTKKLITVRDDTGVLPISTYVRPSSLQLQLQAEEAELRDALVSARLLRAEARRGSAVKEFSREHIYLPKISSTGVLQILHCEILDRGSRGGRGDGFVRVGDHYIVLARVHKMIAHVESVPDEQQKGLTYAHGTFSTMEKELSPKNPDTTSKDTQVTQIKSNPVSDEEENVDLKNPDENSQDIQVSHKNPSIRSDEVEPEELQPEKLEQEEIESEKSITGLPIRKIRVKGMSFNQMNALADSYLQMADTLRDKIDSLKTPPPLPPMLQLRNAFEDYTLGSEKPVVFRIKKHLTDSGISLDLIKQARKLVAKHDIPRRIADEAVQALPNASEKAKNEYAILKAAEELAARKEEIAEMRKKRAKQLRSSRVDMSGPREKRTETEMREEIARPREECKEQEMREYIVSPGRQRTEREMREESVSPREGRPEKETREVKIRKYAMRDQNLDRDLLPRIYEVREKVENFKAFEEGLAKAEEERHGLFWRPTHILEEIKKDHSGVKFEPVPGERGEENEAVDRKDDEREQDFMAWSTQAERLWTMDNSGKSTVEGARSAKSKQAANEDVEMTSAIEQTVLYRPPFPNGKADAVSKQAANNDIEMISAIKQTAPYRAPFVRPDAVSQPGEDGIVRRVQRLPRTTELRTGKSEYQEADPWADEFS